jgi:hypothetical protein
MDLATIVVITLMGYARGERYRVMDAFPMKDMATCRAEIGVARCEVRQFTGGQVSQLRVLRCRITEDVRQSGLHRREKHQTSVIDEAVVPLGQVRLRPVARFLRSVAMARRRQSAGSGRVNDSSTAPAPIAEKSRAASLMRRQGRKLWQKPNACVGPIPKLANG